MQFLKDEEIREPHPSQLKNSLMERKKEFTSKQDFLLDTLQYYVGHPERRCTQIDGGCFYSPAIAKKEGESEGCAIGRHLDGLLQIRLEGNGAIATICHRLPGLYEQLPFWMKDLGVDFLTAMQNLHDCNEHWQDDGQLSAYGQTGLRRIINTHSLPEHLFSEYFKITTNESEG